MILHVYHCNLAALSDYRTASGKNRPPGTGRYPMERGAVDVAYLPPTTGFGDRRLGELLQVFQSVNITSEEESAVQVNWQFLEQRLGATRSELAELLDQAERRSLLPRLTIDYDHVAWMKQSREKGCLVVMTCVERADLSRSPADYLSAYGNAIDDIVKAVINADQILRRVIVVPNGHLDRAAIGGIPWEAALGILKEIPAELRRRGYDVALNSYGHAKMIRLAINAHKLGYTLRVV